MNQREYTRLKSVAEAEYRRKIEAIETVWKLSGGNRQNGAKLQETGVSNGSLRQAIAEVVLMLSGEFSVRDVQRHLTENSPEFAEVKRPSISSVLKRMASDNEIALVTLGSGKRASSYRRTG
jgi:Fe2+ or Zn2+ uptake regulation protein